MNLNAISILLTTLIIIQKVHGHGMMLEPVGRASRWRFNHSAPPNYDDSQLYCGGLYKQWNVNKGKCGLCGDDYSLKTPRPHEIGGKYGEGVIVRTYQSGNLIPISVKITANHKGYFYFHLCDLDRNYENELCYKQYPLRLYNNEYKYYLPSYSPGWFNLTLKLPNNLICNHCVLRWTYHAANNWGMCPNGTGAIGCGPQENFRSCADIQILPKYSEYLLSLPIETNKINLNNYEQKKSNYEINNDFIDNNDLNEYSYNIQQNNEEDNIDNENIYKKLNDFYNRNNEDSKNLNQDSSLEFNIPNVPLPILIDNNRIDE